ncbi:MAG: Fe-S cluster assembly protein SufB [Candidatus Kerfeldbacteria bacterium RIFCSPHIGHO2_12_FULL_48_17]|uniref:Fe-S cluster assembly protein SufB n=1 Tax=Candidatus Kerfeldbacteria bacterium RIFCSPHIGHO2_12_FULL_48_17 TaxID=1798542 RepID=A0A1G2AWY8_9BACT|nr:MAG: Fe-S cluster assembly protein SufB [Candidatus Kerfeldbacteria bacterium RIFCSPHIGHO2_12_FULL_48_17]
MPTARPKNIQHPQEDYKPGFHVQEKSVFKTQKGLSEDVVRQISAHKNEPTWMTDFRLKAYATFLKKRMPPWGADLSTINFDDIYYYLKPVNQQGRTWNDIPDEIKSTFDRLGIPQAERRYLAGVGAQYESEVVYHSISKHLEDKGVIFMDTDQALHKHPEIFRKYFSTIVPPADNKFAALNSAVWSGGTFLYVPAGVHVELPLQAYFRINAEKMGQFERTLIIAEEGSSVHYVEGCSAPSYSSESLHSAVVEIVVKKGARVQYTTIQNWDKKVYNLVTKRAQAFQDATMFWLDGNLGSKITMKYPSVYLMEPGARAEILSLAFASDGQHQDAGGKAIHVAPNTTSRIISRSISKRSGRSSYRGTLEVHRGATGVKSHVVCDALLLDKESRSDTYPTMKVEEASATVEHEATVRKISEEQLFYLQSRGLTEDAARGMIVNGFVEPIVKELPMEYAVEMNRLIEMEMEGSIG